MTSLGGNGWCKYWHPGRPQETQQSYLIRTGIKRNYITIADQINTKKNSKYPLACGDWATNSTTVLILDLKPPFPHGGTTLWQQINLLGYFYISSRIHFKCGMNYQTCFKSNKFDINHQSTLSLVCISQSASRYYWHLRSEVVCTLRQKLLHDYCALTHSDALSCFEM